VIETSVAQTQTIEECEVLAYVRGFEERTIAAWCVSKTVLFGTATDNPEKISS
jgi:hypothetical protein